MFLFLWNVLGALLSSHLEYTFWRWHHQLQWLQLLTILHVQINGYKWDLTSLIPKSLIYSQLSQLNLMCPKLNSSSPLQKCSTSWNSCLYVCNFHPFSCQTRKFKSQPWLLSKSHSLPSKQSLILEYSLSLLSHQSVHSSSFSLSLYRFIVIIQCVTQNVDVLPKYCPRLVL